MLRFTVLSGARTGARFEIGKPVARLGRAPDNDVVFDPNLDLDASAHHAEVRAEGTAWVLVDLNSRNGVFLPDSNMQRISRHPLGAPEVFQLGPQGPRFSVEVLAPPQTTLRSAGAEPLETLGTGPTAYAGPPAPGAGPGHTELAEPRPAPPYAAAGVTQPQGGPPPVPNIDPPGPPAVAAPGGPGAPAAGAGDGKMGQQTLLAHVNALVGQQKRGKSTLEIKALVDQNVQKATGKMRAIIGVLIALVALAGGAIVFLAFRKEDPETLRKELEKLAMNDPRRKEIEQKLGEKSPENPDIGHNIYEGNKDALFMLVAHKGKTYDKGGFCTAFAIKPRVLASNAHCVRAAEDFEDQGAEIYAHLNESSKKGKPKMLKVGRHKGHPAYRHNAQNITPDVGLFTLEDEDAGALVTIAPENELERLGTGDALYVLGFPGRTMDEESPVAVFMFSHVGRITDEFGQRADKFKDAWLVQHEGQTTPGTSGSPIFNGDGHVVAINAGGLLEQNQQAVYKYAMRIDLLEAIDLSSASDDDDDDDVPEKKKKKKSAPEDGDDDDDDHDAPKKKKPKTDDDEG